MTECTGPHDRLAVVLRAFRPRDWLEWIGTVDIEMPALGIALWDVSIKRIDGRPAVFLHRGVKFDERSRSVLRTSAGRLVFTQVATFTDPDDYTAFSRNVLAAVAEAHPQHLTLEQAHDR